MRRLLHTGLAVLFISRVVVSAEPPRLEIPKASWEPIFFKPINSAARSAGLSDLRQFAVADGDLELRVWEGFGVFPLNGYVLQHYAGEWSAWRIKSNSRGTRFRAVRVKRETDWTGVWTELLDAGLITIRDDSELERRDVGVFDGTSYVVELNQDGMYLTYMVNNPDLLPSPDATQMLAVKRVLRKAFGVP